MNPIQSLRPLALAGAWLLAASTASGQSMTETFVFGDMWLLPDTSHPGSNPHQMTGTFEWTYDVGQFENGTARLVEASIPWWGSDISALQVTFDLNQVEVTFPGNFHGLGLDISLRFLTDLAPGQVAEFDPVRSRFDIEVGISHKGHVILGDASGVLNEALFCAGDGTATACPCGNNGQVVGGCSNSTGAGASIDATGTASVAADDLSLGATGLAPGALALVITGDARAGGGAGVLLGDGLLCVGGTIQRLRAAVADGAGSVTVGQGLVAQAGIAAGETRHFQWWYRDVTASPCGASYNLTNATSVTFVP